MVVLLCTSLQTLVEQCASDDADTEFNMGCVLFKVCTCKY